VAILLRCVQVKFAELDNQSNWTHHETLDFIRPAVCDRSAVYVGACRRLTESRESSMSVSGGKVARAKAPVDDKNGRHEDGKESAR
jgi:hypothetical protein